MSGALKPQQMLHDPTNPALQPLIQQLASQLGGGGFNADMWGGQFGAPVNTMQLDSMGALQRMLESDPLVQTSDIQSALAQSLGGGGPQAAGTDLSAYNQMFGDVFGQAGQAGQGLQGTDLSGIMEGLSGVAGGTRAGLGDINQSLQSALGGVSPTDLSGIMAQMQGLSGGLAGGVPGTDMIQQASQLPPELQQLFQSALPAFQQGLQPQSFDTTEMFQNARQVFEGDLDRSLASAREEYSALGLDPGSATRAAGLARTGADASAQFNLGQQEIARQGFESAQNRGTQTLGMAPGLSQAFGSGQDRMLQAGGLLGQLGLQGTGMQGDMLSQLAGMSQVPFGEALSLGQAQNQFGLQGADIASRNLLGAGGLESNALGQMGQLSQIPFQEMLAGQQLGLQGTGMQGNLLGEARTGAQIPFQEAMQQFQAGLQGQQVGAGMLPGLMQAFNNPAMMAQMGFGMGETVRQGEQGTLDRMMAEHGRTQNAMLPFMMQLLAGTPQTQAAYGPSTVSQLGSLAQGIGSLFV